VACLLVDLVGEAFKNECFSGYMDGEAGQLPVVVAYVGLLQERSTSFVQVANEAEPKVYVGNEVAVEQDYTLLCLIDPELTREATEDVGLEVGWRPVWVWCEAEAVTLSRVAGGGTFGLVEERVGKEAQEIRDAIAILVFTFASSFLQFRVRGERIEAVELGLVGIGLKWLAVDCDEPGYVSIECFEDDFGRVVTLVDSTDLVLHEVMMLCCFQPLLYGAAD
jgi:hypothetical protein